MAKSNNIALGNYHVKKKDEPLNEIASSENKQEELIEIGTDELKSLMERELEQQRDKYSDITICELITKQALEFPSRTAIIDGEITIDYETLMLRAGQVSGELKHQGIEPGSLVAVCMLRSWELVAVLIGVMQAGCAYVPLDPTYPKNRIQYMLSHSRAVAAITSNHDTAQLCFSVNKVIKISDIGDHSDNLISVSGSDLAYVIYTSGSTGNPKGVAVEHKGLVLLSQSMGDLFSEEDLQGVFAGASVCFDTSVMELMGSLSLGGTVILAKNALELTRLPASNQIKVVVMVASAMRALLANETLPENLRCLVFGGEALKSSLVEHVLALRPGLRIFNAYGPTEDTVYSTIAEIDPQHDKITIGKSVRSSRAYILGEDMLPVAVGETGELYLAGDKLAREYLYDAARTKERFIEWSATELIPESRLYKTGDLCRWTEYSEIEYIERADQQVKVRGYRIELEEIETALERMSGIDAAALVALDSEVGQKILVAFVVSQNHCVTETSIKHYLSQNLPKYMVPQTVRHIDALPYLPNDKLDRRKLLTLAKAAPLVEVSSTGSSVTKSELLTIIQRELASILYLSEPNQIVPEQTFDSLGLDSLSTLEFNSRLSKVLNQKVPVSLIQQSASPQVLVDNLTGMFKSIDDQNLSNASKSQLKETLTGFQFNLQSSHPTFQVANADAWGADDKSKLLQEMLQLVNRNRINPYGKILQTGSSARGLVGDSYNDEVKESIIWSTNLYFGLNRDPRVIKEAALALERFGTGMGISAAATGMTNQHLEFEKEFAELVGKPGACLFPTGYTANLGAVSGLVGQNDVVIIDQLCHASIVDGARLSGATIRTFRHNSAEDLAAVLESEVSPYRTTLVVLESVYSMGEGTAPVADIVRTAKKYNALVLVDEAHSFGFYGENGAGICAEQGVTEDVDFIMATLSKAMGSIGGVVAASKQHIDLLKASSRAYIFQASISPADIAAGLTALRCLRSDNRLREQLWEITYYMRQRFEEEGYDLGTGDGPIVTPHFGDKDKLYAIVKNLYKRGVQTLAVTYPIVEPGRGRLRLICSSAHTREDVDKTLEALALAEQEANEEVASKGKILEQESLSMAELTDWTEKFAAYVKSTLANSKQKAGGLSHPNLAVSFSLTDQTECSTILFIDGRVSIGSQKSDELPGCHLQLSSWATIAALQSADNQVLLQSILDGHCILKGQVEPFIWFMGRMVDYAKTSLC